MHEYNDLEQDLAKGNRQRDQARFHRFQSMMLAIGQPDYSPSPQGHDPLPSPPPPPPQIPPPPQPQQPPTPSQHPAHPSQRQVSPGIQVPLQPNWSGPENRVNVVVEEYVVL